MSLDIKNRNLAFFLNKTSNVNIQTLPVLCCFLILEMFSVSIKPTLYLSLSPYI